MHRSDEGKSVFVELGRAGTGQRVLQRLHMTQERLVLIATWLLRLMGVSLCMAIFPIFFPISWMASIHRRLGLGEIPEQPIFEYLARSLSAMYFAHGCFVIAASSNVVRFKLFLWVIGFLNIFLGTALLFTDLLAPMPLYWTLLEGPLIIAAGALLLWLTFQLADPSPG